MEHRTESDLDRVRHLASVLARTDPGPAAELALQLTEVVAAQADDVAALSARLDALWQLITAVVESAGLSGPPADEPPPEFIQAITSARSTGRRGVRLSIDGQDWVAALSQRPPEPDPASWAAIERLARESGDDQDER